MTWAETDNNVRPMNRQTIIAKIEEAHRITGLAPSTICHKAIKNSKTYATLVDGKPGPGIDQINALFAWIDEAITKAKA